MLLLQSLMQYVPGKNLQLYKIFQAVSIRSPQGAWINALIH